MYVDSIFGGFLLRRWTPWRFVWIVADANRDGGADDQSTATSAVVIPEADTELKWSAEVLGAAPRGGVALGVNQNGKSLVLSADSSQGLVWVDGDSGFEPGFIEGAPTEDTGWLGPVVVGSEMLTAINDYESFTPQIWRSGDGRMWRRIDTVGLDDPADGVSLVSIDGRAFLVGTLRVGPDPGNGPFRPAIWLSDDLTTWKLAQLDSLGEGAVLDIARTPSGLLAVGHDDYRIATWTSDDGGNSWTPGQESLGMGNLFGRVSGVAQADETVAILAHVAGEDLEDSVVILVSHDGAKTWSESRLEPTDGSGIDGSSHLSFSGGAFWIVGSRWIDLTSDRCYVDIDACRASSESVLLRSIDGEKWQVVDLTDVAPAGTGRLLAIGTRGDGVMALVSDGTSLIAWTWPSTDSPAVRSRPEIVPTPPIETVRWDAQLEVGRTYRFPLYTHCGIRYLANFNNAHWYLIDPTTAQIDTGGVPRPDPDWLMAQQSIIGMVTLIDETTINYSLPSGEVIATYRSSDIEPPMCM